MLGRHNCCVYISEINNTSTRNLQILHSVSYLLKNVYKQKMVYGAGNIRLLRKFSLDIMLRLYHFFLYELNYMSRNPCQVPNPYAVSLATDLKENAIFVIF